jgi:uncharacterized protein (DUF1501 family)
MKRREFLSAGALALGSGFLTSRVAFARTEVNSKARVVFVILRGALDGLAAAPPYGDPDYAGLRRELALKAPGTPGGVLPLNEFVGLHPSLGFLHDSYSARELIVFHAVASPYRERSHFDGQDVLENGSVHPHAVQTGWLNRALASLQASGRGSGRELGVALGQNVPLIMRGPASVTSWSPSKLAALDEDTLERIADLYAADPLLAARLADALAANAIADEPQTTMQGAVPSTTQSAFPSMTVNAPEMQDSPATGKSLLQRVKPARYTEVVHAAAGFLRRDDGPQVAVFDTTGWDTHANEGSAEGQLAGRLAALDCGLRTLKDELGPVWTDTVVVLATEFGRTAAVNGTRGTDHGTATAAFLVGGAVQGGRVMTDWPGLSSRSLYQGRDLKPTTDLRSVLKGMLAEHMLVSTNALENSVFPDSAEARPCKGLVRG